MVEIIGSNLGDGYCHCFWAEKKQILKEAYGIDWKSPATDIYFPGINRSPIEWLEEVLEKLKRM